MKEDVKEELMFYVTLAIN